MPSRRAVFEATARQLDAELITCRRLTGGSSADVWCLDLLFEDGPRSVVFRRHEPGRLKDHGARVAAKEFHLLQQLHARAFPVPEPLLVDDDARLLVTEFVGGESSVSSAELTSALGQMVDLLARVHALDPAILNRTLVPPLEDPRERMTDALPMTDAGRRLRAVLEAGAIDVPAGRVVLVHGDYWPGNLLWRQGRIAALIDWEDACIGDPLADLACARLEVRCAYGDDAASYLTNEYSVRAGNIDPRALGLWDAYVAATALASMHLWGLEAAAEAGRRRSTTEFLDRAVDELLD